MDNSMVSILVAQGTAALNAGDLDRAVQLLSQAARQDNAVAMFNLAITYMRLGDLDSSIWWYKAASSAGDVDATAYLGFIYKRAGDLWEAERWYRKAVAEGSAGAKALLEILHADGQNPGTMVARESSWSMGRGHALNGFTEEAKASWTMAAEMGHVESMYSLGLLSEREGNVGLAMLWYTEATRAGSELAHARLAELTSSQASRGH